MAGSPQVATYKNPDGSVSGVSVTYTWTPPPPPLPPPAPMRIGNSAGAAPGKGPDFTKYPGTSVCTLFNAAGAGLNVAAIKAVPASVYPLVCVKDPWAAVAAAVKTAAGLGIRFGLVPHHEPEDDMQLAAYLANFNAFADGCEQWDNVDVGCKLNGYIESKVGADFHPWITKREQFACVDLYSQDPTAYPDPKKFAALAASVQDYAGVRGGFAEFNALRTTGDTTGAGRAAWISQVVAESRREGFAFAMPWDGLGSKTTKYPGGIPFGPFPLTSPEYGATLALIATQ